MQSFQTIKATHDPAFCDAQTFHQINQVQPFGVLIVIENCSLQILQVSQNVQELLGLSAEAVHGHYINKYVEQSSCEYLALALAKTLIEQTFFCDLHFHSGKKFRAFIYKQDKCSIVEIEFVNEITATSDEQNVLMYGHINAINFLLSRAIHLPDVFSAVASSFMQHLGFDRVMVYRFDQDANGEIVAEEKVPELESFLGLRFPATDIPKPARDLYLRNPVRTISSRDYTPVDLYPSAKVSNGPYADLSHCRLRAVMPVHLEYMRNMGVAASASIRIMHEGSLWGLVVCHHATSKILTYGQIQYLDIASSLCSSRISALVNSLAQRKLQERRVLYREFEQAIDAHFDVFKAFDACQTTLMSLLRCDGVVLYWSGKRKSFGSTPDDALLEKLFNGFVSEKTHPVYTQASLSKEIPEAIHYSGTASGVIILAVDPASKTYVLGFRGEQTQYIKWAGNPQQTLTAVGNTYHPRHSFAKWEQIVRFTSHPYTAEDVLAGHRVRSKLIEKSLAMYSSSLETQVLQRTADLEAASKHLERVSEELRQVTFVTTHSIQESMRKIGMYSRHLDRKVNDLQSIEAVVGISEQSTRIRHLITELERYSRSGQVQSFTIVDLNLILGEVLHELKREIDQYGMRVFIEHLPSVPGIQAELKELLFCVVQNAVKFSRFSDGPHIQIYEMKTADAEVSGEYATIIVADNGCGFDQTYSPEVFSLFRKLHQDPRFEGEGVGLAIAKKIVDAHRGKCHIQSEMDRGTTFTIVLPKANDRTDQSLLVR